MEFFANAAYGIIPDDKTHLKLEKLVEEVFDGQVLDDDEEEMSYSDAVSKASDMEPCRKIIKKLGFPDSACLLSVSKTVEGCPLDEGTLIVGWGILGFPATAFDPGFREFVKKRKDLDWHLWVSN